MTDSSTPPQAPKPPAGFYPDESGKSRWWDGDNWTDQYQAELEAEPATVAAEASPTKSSKKQKRVLILVSIAVIAITAGGIYGLHAKSVSDHKAEVKAAQIAKEKKARDKIKAEFKQCTEETEDFLATMQDIVGLTEAGVNQANYGSAVGKAAGESRRVADLSDDCETSVVDNLDEALDTFTKQNSEWNDCIYRNFDAYDSCDVDDLDLSTPWFGASLKVSLAEIYLSGDGFDHSDESDS